MSKKYRLIKLYPGSPKLGTEWEIEKFCSKFWPPDYKEFWEEIVEKDYEILEFTSDNKIKYTLNTNGKYYDISRDALPFGVEDVDYKNVEITKVKRLSDGVIFSLGDKVQTNDKKIKGIIETLAIRNTIILALLSTKDLEEPKVWVVLKLLEHYKEPILITEDGVELFEGNDVFFVEVGEYLHHGKEKVNSNKYNYNLDKSFKYFSTKEKALEYIDLNKPRFSKKEIKEQLGRLVYTDINKHIMSSICNKLGI